MQPRLLLLWDVDHTLIETCGVGFAIYQRAFRAATGQPLVDLARVSGRTELDIMRETLRINGIDPTDEAVGMLAAALVRGYDNARDELATTGRALPGVRDTLASLAANTAIVQTVLTGNVREVARIKLEVFGLNRYLDLDAGAYGDDHQERAELVPIARERAGQRSNITFDKNATVLIGDTTNDVVAGLRAGVRVIAVATGKTSAVELREAGATQVVRAVNEVADLLQKLV